MGGGPIGGGPLGGGPLGARLGEGGGGLDSLKARALSSLQVMGEGPEMEGVNYIADVHAHVPTRTHTHAFTHGRHADRGTRPQTHRGPRLGPLPSVM